MKMQTLLMLLLSLFLSMNVWGQETRNYKVYDGRKYIVTDSGIILPSIEINGEIFPHIPLRQIVIQPPLHLKNRRDKREYLKISKYIVNAYNYAHFILREMQEVNAHLATLANGREKKRYASKYKKEMRKRFNSVYGRDITDLTAYEGKLIVKIIARETDASAYDFIAEYLGDFRAIFWQGVAIIFDNSLKKKYDPKGEDRLLEYILTDLENRI
jgi:hypothetical protein